MIYFRRVNSEGDFEILWDDGVVETGSIASRTGLETGTYSVTMTSNVTGCFSTLDIEVPEVESGTALEVSVDHSPNICPQSQDGFINLHISGGVRPYTITWDHPSSVCFRTSCDDLEVGSYCVTVTDFCGQSIDGCIQIDATISASMLSDTACYGEGRLEVTDLVAPGEVSYFWSVNGPTRSYRNNLPPGLHEVRITDEGGCFIELEAEVISPHISMINSDSACIGFPSDVVATIFNPFREDTVFIRYDSIPFYPINTMGEEVVEVPLGQLMAGESHSVHLEAANCEHISSHFIPTKSLEYQNVEFDFQSLRCHDERYCDSILIDSISYPAVTVADFEESTLFCCKAPIYCSQNQVDVLHGDRATFKVGVYLKILEELIASSSPLDAGRLYANHAYVKSSFGDEECSKVRVCLATMDVLYHKGGPLKNVAKSSRFDEYGCLNLDCYWPRSDEYCCPYDIFLMFPFWNAPPIEQEPCIPKTTGIYNLYLRLTDPLLPPSSLPEGFVGSELYNFVLDYGGHPHAPCANVTFCQRDYSVLFHNLDQVFCGIIPDACCDTTIYTCDFTPIDDDCLYGSAYCFLDQGPYTYTNLFVKNKVGTSIFDVTPSSDEQFLFSTMRDPQFLQYSLVSSDDFVEPMAMIDAGNRYFMDDYIMYGSKNSYRTTDLFYAYEDMDRELSYNIYKLDEDRNMHLLRASAPSRESDYILEGVELKKCVYDNGIVLCHIVSHGDIKVDNTTYTGKLDTSNWLLAFDETGYQLSDYANIVPVLAPRGERNKPLLCLEGLDPLMIDSLDLPVSEDAQMGVFDPSSMDLLAEASSDQGFRLYGMAAQDSTDDLAFIFEGEGELQINGVQYSLDAQTPYHLLCGSSSNMTDKIALQVDSLHPNSQVHHHGDSMLILSLNFKGQVAILADTTINSTNDTWDLAILRLHSGTGQYELLEHIEHPMDVILEESLPTAEILFYTISTQMDYQQSISLGERTIYNMGNLGKHILTSHLPIYTYEIPEAFCLDDTLTFDSSATAMVSLEDILDSNGMETLNSIYLENDTIICADGNPARLELSFVNTLGETSSCVSEIYIANWAEECCSDSVIVSVVDPNVHRFYANNLIRSDAAISALTDSVYFQSSELLLDSGFHVPLGIQFQFLSKPCDEQ